MSNGDLNWIANFIWGIADDRVVTGKPDGRDVAASLPEIIEARPIDNMVEDDDLDEAVEDAENEEVAA